MNHYIRDIALYGVVLFAVGVGWEVVSAVIQRFKTPTFRFRKPA